MKEKLKGSIGEALDEIIAELTGIRDMLMQTDGEEWSVKREGIEYELDCLIAKIGGKP